MARDDDEREIDDTTVIAGGQKAWSDVDRSGSAAAGPDATPPAEIPLTDAAPPVDPPTEVLPVADPILLDGGEPADSADPGDSPAFSPEGVAYSAEGGRVLQVERRPERRPVDARARLVTDEAGEGHQHHHRQRPGSGTPRQRLRDQAHRPAHV